MLRLNLKNKIANKIKSLSKRKQRRQRQNLSRKRASSRLPPIWDPTHLSTLTMVTRPDTWTHPTRTLRISFSTLRTCHTTRMWSPRRLTWKPARAPSVTSSIQFRSLLFNKSTTRTKHRMLNNSQNPNQTQLQLFKSPPVKKLLWRPSRSPSLRQKPLLRPRLRRWQASLPWEREWWATGAPNEDEMEKSLII